MHISTKRDVYQDQLLRYFCMIYRDVTLLGTKKDNSNLNMSKIFVHSNIM
jgi:hypothetical protein